MGILSAIMAALKALPALRDILKWFGVEMDKQRERTAENRMAEKDAAVDAGIDAALDRVRQRKAEQQPKADEPS